VNGGHGYEPIDKRARVSARPPPEDGGMRSYLYHVSFSNTAYRWHSDPSPDATLPLDIPEEASEAEWYRAERDHRRHTFDQLAARFLGPVIVVNDEGRLTHWNCEQAQFTDTDAEVALGRPAYEVIGTETKTETLVETVTETGDAVRESESEPSRRETATGRISRP